MIAQALASRNNNSGQSEASRPGLGQSEASKLTLDVQDVSILPTDVRVLRVGGPEASDHYHLSCHDDHESVRSIKRNHEI